MMAEAPMTDRITPATAVRGRFLASRSAARVRTSSAPVRTSAPITMNIAAIVQGAGLLKTPSAVS